MAERSDGLVFSYLLRNSIVSCIADLEGNPDRDYSIFRIDSLYHTALRFDHRIRQSVSVRWIFYWFNFTSKELALWEPCWYRVVKHIYMSISLWLKITCLSPRITSTALRRTFGKGRRSPKFIVVHLTQVQMRTSKFNYLISKFNSLIS
jgi:hypothetical protein